MKKFHLVHMVGPDSFPVGADSSNPAALVQLARQLEDASFSALVFPNFDGPAAMRAGQLPLPWEPFTACGALAVATRSIRLVPAVAAATSEPYNVARRLASLDHISGGRIGWNLAASVAGLADQYGDRRGPGRPISPAVVREFTDVVKALWNSWGSDAIIVRENGRAAVDGSKNYPINHQGPYYRVRGPLDVPRPPWGDPPLFQCVDSDEDFASAARYADVVMPGFHTSKELGQFRQQFAEALQKNSRTFNEVKLLPRFTSDGLNSVDTRIMGVLELAMDGWIDGICISGKNVLNLSETIAADLRAVEIQVTVPSGQFMTDRTLD